MSFLFTKVPLKTPKRDADGAWSYFDGALKTWALKSTDNNSTSSRQVFKYSSPHTGAGRASTATPPYHWHLHQTERFEVQSGVLCYDIDGKEGKLHQGQSATVLPGHSHTFWLDPESKQDLDVHVTVSPKVGFNDPFIHNFYGYLSSVTMQGQKPSLFQMLAFLDNADVVLSDFPLGTGRIANVVLGRWLGRGLLGYKVEYKEFNSESD
jgi:mannose-6-phosphate isomerase-like protein (cupin superfamily)